MFSIFLSVIFLSVIFLSVIFFCLSFFCLVLRVMFAGSIKFDSITLPVDL